MQPTRRQVLLAAGVTTASACTADKPLRPTVPSVQDRLRAEAVARERALVDAYTASLAAHPARRALLTTILGDHAAHLAALDHGTSTPSPAASAPPPRASSLAQLAALEKQAARRYAEAAERAETDCDDDSLLLLLASLAACEASHAALL